MNDLRTTNVESGEKGNIQAIQYLAILTVIALAIFGTLVNKALFADGSYWFLRIMELDGFFILPEPRFFAQILTQSPVFVLLFFGVDQLTILTYAHSAGLVMVPALIWLRALMLHLNTRTFWFILLCYSVSSTLTGFMAISEANVAHALVGYCFAALIKPVIPKWDRVFLVVSSILVTASYESLVFLGPLLLALSIQKLISVLRNDELDLGIAVTLSISGTMFATAGAVSLLSIFSPRDPNNLSGAANFLPSLLSPTGLIAIAFLTILALDRILISKKTKMVLSLTLAGLALLYLLFPSSWLTPSENYQMRVASGLLLFFCICITLWSLTRPRLTSSEFNLGFASIGLLVVFSLPQFVHNYNWAIWTGQYQQTIQELKAWTPFNETDLAGSSLSYFQWGWNNPSLSLILRGDSPSGILNNADISFNPYSPFGEMPDPTRNLVK